MSTTPQAASAAIGARTPSRRAISTEPPSTARRALVHTPLDRSVTRDLLRSVRRGTPASASRRKSNAPTPHAKAARRALDQRRAAMFTPGKNRRKSLMEQRETPMGVLGQLAKVLKTKGGPTASSSTSASSPPPSTRRRSSTRPIREEDEDDFEDDFVDDDNASSDDPPLKRPRLSLPIDEDNDDDDDELKPPRLSGFEEFDYTVRSIELPRRYLNSEEAASQFPRPSLGSLRGSDYLDNDETIGTGGRPSDFFPGGFEGLQATLEADNDTLPGFEIDPTRQPSMGGESGFDFQVPAGLEDGTTFMMSEPDLNAARTSPLEERSITQAVGDHAAEAQDGPAPAEFDLETPVFGDYSDDGNEPLDPFDDLPGYGDNVDDSDPGEFEDALENPTEDVTAATTKALQPTASENARAAIAIQDARKQLQLRKKRKRVSQHGIEYPPLPSAFVKKVAQTALQSSGLSNTRVSADTLVALTQASEWYFEQLGDDLGAYAGHAKRKTIEDSDVATLMRRQRQVSSASTLFSLAQKHLPRELLQELRMPLPQPTKYRRAKPARSGDDEEELEAA